MEVVNDARLMELVREPARELLPAVRRASVVQPLVILLVFLPGLLGFWNRTLDEATCRQGLLAFDVAAGMRPMDWFVIASRNAAESSTPMFPLPMLATALGLQVELLSPESRLLLVSYLSSSFLLLCLSCLAKKVGGSRYALLVVCLACGHREFLVLSESLPPAAIPLGFAALSFRTMLSHQTAGQPLISWPLLASSLTLAACWLSGGELALACLGVLLAINLSSAFSRENLSARSTLKRAVRQRLWKLSIAVLNFVLVTTIAVAIVAGWQSLSSDRIARPMFAGSSFWFRRLWPVETSAVESVQALWQMIGAWLGFLVIGVVQMTRRRMREQRGLGTESAWLLVAWAIVGWLSWRVTWPEHHGAWTDSVSWPGFLLLPMLFFAAWGLEAVLRRELGIGTVVTATLATLGVYFAPQWTTRLPNPVTATWIAACVVTAAIAIGAGLIVIRRLAKSEAHSRRLLLSCVALVALTDTTNGVFSRRRLADDERELLAFRRQLITEPAPDHCWLITENSSPARLQFFLRSLWRGVTLQEAESWETVLLKPSQTSAANTVESGAANPRTAPVANHKPRTIVVIWGGAKLPVDDLKRRGQPLTQATLPHYFQGQLLKGYRWHERTEGANSR